MAKLFGNPGDYSSPQPSSHTIHSCGFPLVRTTRSMNETKRKTENGQSTNQWRHIRPTGSVLRNSDKRRMRNLDHHTNFYVFIRTVKGSKLK